MQRTRPLRLPRRIRTRQRTRPLRLPRRTCTPAEGPRPFRLPRRTPPGRGPGPSAFHGVHPHPGKRDPALSAFHGALPPGRGPRPLRLPRRTAPGRGPGPSAFHGAAHPAEDPAPPPSPAQPTRQRTAHLPPPGSTPPRRGIARLPPPGVHPTAERIARLRLPRFTPPRRGSRAFAFPGSPHHAEGRPPGLPPSASPVDPTIRRTGRLCLHLCTTPCRGPPATWASTLPEENSRIDRGVFKIGLAPSISILKGKKAWRQSPRPSRPRDLENPNDDRHDPPFLPLTVARAPGRAPVAASPSLKFPAFGRTEEIRPPRVDSLPRRWGPASSPRATRSAPATAAQPGPVRHRLRFTSFATPFPPFPERKRGHHSNPINKTLAVLAATMAAGIPRSASGASPPCSLGSGPSRPPTAAAEAPITSPSCRQDVDEKKAAYETAVQAANAEESAMIAYMALIHTARAGLPCRKRSRTSSPTSASSRSRRRTPPDG